MGICGKELLMGLSKIRNEVGKCESERTFPFKQYYI